MALAFLLAFTGGCRTLVRSLFDSWSHQGVAGAVAIAVISVAVATGATVAGAMWTGAAEMVRLGNEHVSGRLRSFPFKSNFSLLFVANLAIFWALAWRPFRRAMTSDTPPSSRSVLQ